jgi:hypothetical protein
MTEESQHPQKRRSKLWMIPAALAVIVSVIVIPPLVSIGRYQARITRAMSASLGRPVRLASVELRLLPRPGFVLTDLTVDEDPAYGVEPVLHANTVTAAIRLLSLWRGRLEISRISVDEASLNLLRTADGRWNIDPIFRNAAGTAGSAPRKAVALPYLEATNSRVNIKRGLEKLPYSLIDADLSFWQEDSGDWLVRLRGQPARTDVSLDSGDTGTVRLDARLRRAQQLREMPIHLDLQWREAQLGQLSKLLLGTDPGWRGDLTGEAHLDGNTDSADVTTRLRAVGVHRAEFSPAAPLDFDARCGFTYHYSQRNVEKLVCDSPLGDGHLRLEGNLPSGGKPALSLELEKIPAQAVLDGLRTVRNKFGAGLDASGSINGKLIYDPNGAPVAPIVPAATRSKAVRNAATHEKAEIPHHLSGSLTVDGLRVSGDALSQPVQIQKVVFEPSNTNEQTECLTSSVNLSAGGATPLVVAIRLSSSGYDLGIHGPGAIVRLRELAVAAGLPEVNVLKAVAGDPVTLDLAIAGPWLPSDEQLRMADAAAVASSSQALTQVAPTAPLPDHLAGTVTLHNANWKCDALTIAVEIPQATLHLGGPDLRWDPVLFVYGSLKGTAALRVPAACRAGVPCLPQLDIRFASVNAAAVQAALLGAPKSSTLISSVIARLTPSSVSQWPEFDGTVSADSLILGPVTLQNAAITLHVQSNGAELTNIEASLLGGSIAGKGSVKNSGKPNYSIEGQFARLNPAALCQLLALQCKGSGVSGDGKIDLAGFTGEDLAVSANGQLHFDWHQGSFLSHASSASNVPLALSRFDRWTGEGGIADGKITIQQSKIQQGSRASTVDAKIILANPAVISFVPMSRDVTLER